MLNTYPTATSSKIRADHLNRQAFIYVRQSSLAQVQTHTGSTARQYDLVKRVLDLGWPQERIVVIDQDQGHSGSSVEGRDGFQHLMTQVGLGLAGAVVSIEVSRLARACSDWYRLLELCALSHTLVVDDESVYDPNQYNDRLLLGFKGTMSEAELHWLSQRMQGGKLAKAEKGELRCQLPVGLSYNPVGQIVLDPDEQVQQAVRLVFSLFEQVSSARAVVRRFREQHLLFPVRPSDKLHAGDLAWRTLSYCQVLSVLHNPFYAGAYVYGRVDYGSKAVPGASSTCELGEKPSVKVHCQRRKLAEWPIVLLDHHTGYLNWEAFLANQQKLTANRTDDPARQAGPPREGVALLVGLVRCGRCGQRMRVQYHQHGSERVFGYHCTNELATNQLCQQVQGRRVDEAVVAAFLAAVQPAQLEVALGALAELKQQAHQVAEQWQLRLERSHYEADLARRRFVLVDPENRLVARTLEQEWNKQLSAVAQLEREYQELPRAELELAVNETEQAQLMALTHQLPVVWQAATTSQAERKQLLRYLIRDVTLYKEAESIQIEVRWQSGAVSELRISRLPDRARWQGVQTPAKVIQRLAELSVGHTDAEIACQLNAEGYRSCLGRAFTASNVCHLRGQNSIKKCEQAGEKLIEAAGGSKGHYRVREVAKVLKVSVSTVTRWCKEGRLEAEQSGKQGMYWVLGLPELQEEELDQPGSLN